LSFEMKKQIVASFLDISRLYDNVLIDVLCGVTLEKELPLRPFDLRLEGTDALIALDVQLRTPVRDLCALKKVLQIEFDDLAVLFQG
jgi:hypothetical protein